MNLLHDLRRDWLGNVRSDLLAGLVVALAVVDGSDRVEAGEAKLANQ